MKIGRKVRKGYINTVVRDWKSLQEAIDCVLMPREAPTKEWENNVFLFRGESNASFQPLEPTLLRESKSRNLSKTGMLKIEHRITQDFRKHLHLHDRLGDGHADDAYGRLWGIMRHYGAPTRVLDWTVSPYVGLYFAVRDHFEKDANLWWVSCNAANDRRRERFRVDDSIKIDPTSSRDRLYFVNLVVPAPRAAAQQGYLSFSENVKSNHCSILEAYFSDHLARRWFGRIRIPYKLKREFLLRLRSMNIHGRSLFPDLDGLGMAATDLIRSHPTRFSSGMQFRELV